jgi:hypothetical protein
MTRIVATRLKHHLSGRLTAALVVSTVIAFASFIVPANADWNSDHRRDQNNWNRGDYRAPPIVYGSPYGPSYYGSSYYGSPYNYPPPVVYGPTIGIGLPGININIQ